jgi:predicted GNAT family acetyltransferase
LWLPPIARDAGDYGDLPMASACAFGPRSGKITSMFSRKTKPEPVQATSGRLEIERDGHIAYLEYTLAGKVLQLIHSEVPPALRGRGIASELAHSALEWAREQGLKVDVVCPSVSAYLEKHPEYADLVLR